MRKNKKDVVLYDLNTIYFTIARNAKRIYDELPNETFENNISKAEYYANEIDISVSYLYHIFSGKQESQAPSFQTIIKLCNAFGCSLEQLTKPLSDDEYEIFYKSQVQGKKKNYEK